MAWALTVVLMMLVYSNFPVKGKSCSVKEEERYIVSVSSFWSPNPVLNFALLKAAPAVYSAYLPDTCFPSLSISLNKNTQSMQY